MATTIGFIMNEALADNLCEHLPSGTKAVAMGERDYGIEILGAASALVVDAGFIAYTGGDDLVALARGCAGVPVLVLGDDDVHSAEVLFARAGAKVCFRGREGDADIRTLLRGFVECAATLAGVALARS